jgi:homoserine dehydrogenase
VAHAAFDRTTGALTAWVAPTVVPRESALGRAAGAENAIDITCMYGGHVTMTGVGAGADAVGAAIIGDLRAIARDRAAIVPAPVLVAARSMTGLSAQTFAEAV